MFLLTVFSIAFFMRLGFWQLHRAEEKNQILASQASMERQRPQPWRSEDPLPKPYQPLQITGTFDALVFLLDNQHHDHRFGYNVFSSLLLEDNTRILVDRGWVEGDPSRNSLPIIFVPQKKLTLIGTVYYPSTKGVLLGDVVEKIEPNLAVIESLDLLTLRQLLHNNLYPFIIRLDKREAYGFTREWAVVSMPPQRHYAYALQWFSFALVVLILFISLNLKKKK
jgi:surfeit locus 1 family protein